jgi:hypothetical protein
MTLYWRSADPCPVPSQAARFSKSCFDAIRARAFWSKQWDGIYLLGSNLPLYSDFDEVEGFLFDSLDLVL